MSILHLPLFLRTLKKEREIYALKVATLSIAYACATVLVLFCWNEFGYDRFHKAATNVFRVVLKNTRFDFEGNRYTDRIPDPVYHDMVKTPSPMVLSRCKVIEQQRVLANGIIVDGVTCQAVDPSVDAVFSFDIVAGSLKRFKSDLHTTLLSASQATALFNTTACDNRSIKIIFDNDTVALTVAAVFRDFPLNAHTRFDMLIRFDSIAFEKLSVDTKNTGLYGRLTTEKGSATPAGQQMELVQRMLNSSLHKSDTTLQYELQSLPSIYFGRRVIGESALHGDRYSILMLICIASLITFLAVTNYINLTTLTLPNRSGEIAIKKVAGASQLSVLTGLAIESLFVVMSGMLVAAVILFTVHSILNTMLPVSLWQLMTAHVVVLTIFVPSVILITIAGPLLVALRFVKAPPTRLLSTDRITFPRFKRIITVLQLGISLSLIVAGIVVQRQITRSLVKEPGRNKDQIVYLPYPPGLTDAGLRSQRGVWRANPNIEGVTAASHLPNQLTRKMLNSPFYHLSAEYEFPSLLRYPIIEGRWYGGQDTSAVLINRKGARLHPVFEKPVIGVIEDLSAIYNQSEKPVVVEHKSYLSFNYLFVRIIEVDVRETVAYLERNFDLKPGTVKFLDPKFETWLIYEDHLGALCRMLAIVSLIMAGCAIYGLSLSLGNDKIKQVAIHKMLGASFWNIIGLLMDSFSMPLLVATFSFGLITYIGLSEWLRNFIYKTHLGIEEVLIALGFCIFIILGTALRQAQKLAGANLVGWLNH